MPQLDQVTFFFQSIYIVLTFIITYYFFLHQMFPNMLLSLKQREYLYADINKELKLIKYIFQGELNLILFLYILNKKLLVNYKFLNKIYLENLLKFNINELNNNYFNKIFKIIFKKYLLFLNILKINYINIK